MFDDIVLPVDVFRNVEKDGGLIGYELLIQITWYRGIPLNILHDIKIEIDDQPVPRENIWFSLDGDHFFVLDEIKALNTYQWNYKQQGYVFVKHDGGLPQGQYKVGLTQIISVAYIPIPFSKSQIKTMTVR